MKIVKLPDLPTGTEFEEYTSALLQLGGYHIERNLIFRDIEEILELDVVLTNYESEMPELRIVEIKSGDWGFPDLFKVYGWMKYLGITKGIFIAKKERSHLEFIRDIARQMNIDLCVVPDLSDVKQVLAVILPGIADNHINKGDVSHWRFSYWVERSLLNRLINQRNYNPGMKCYSSLCRYYQEINGGVFFTENIVKKVDKLYSTFADFPRITAKTAHELVGDDFEQEYDELPKNIYEDTFYKCNYTDLHVSMFIEHRARLAILKSAVDYVLYKAGEVTSRTEDVMIDILGFEVSLMNTLPDSFREGLLKISTHKFFHRYPIFWQWFMWLFGGFILKDYEEREYAVLAEKTGIPMEEIQNAFDSYQILFNVDGGWFLEPPYSKVRILKMFPVPFMGIGANYRRWLYGKGEEPQIDNIKVTGPKTTSDLIRWNDLVVDVLTYQPE